MWSQKYKEAKEFMTIADHLLYVTFKHSKNADILKAVIDRIVQAFEKLIDSVVELKYEEGLIENYSKNPRVQLDLFIEILEEKDPIEDFKPREFLNFYLYLRKLKRSKYRGIDNFKRTVKVKFEDENAIMSPKDIQELLEKAKKYFNKIESKYLK